MEISPPITSARSVRRSSATVGNNTCVTRHKPHRDRRGRTSSRRPRPRSARRRANPHGRKRPPPQMTQPYLPAASLASTRAASASTLITRATPRTSDGPLALRTRKRRAVRSRPDAQHAVRRRHRRNQTITIRPRRSEPMTPQAPPRSERVALNRNFCWRRQHVSSGVSGACHVFRCRARNTRDNARLEGESGVLQPPLQEQAVRSSPPTRLGTERNGTARHRPSDGAIGSGSRSAVQFRRRRPADEGAANAAAAPIRYQHPTIPGRRVIERRIVAFASAPGTSARRRPGSGVRGRHVRRAVATRGLGGRVPASATSRSLPRSRACDEFATRGPSKLVSR